MKTVYYCPTCDFECPYCDTDNDCRCMMLELTGEPPIGQCDEYDCYYPDDDEECEEDGDE